MTPSRRSLAFAFAVASLLVAAIPLPVFASDFPLADMRVGRTGSMTWVNAKVLQVVDDDKMLVVLSDARTLRGGKVVLLKCSTKDIVDGQHWSGGEWERYTGSSKQKVAGTYRYRTRSGTRTVYVLEPVKK
jgi:hypothetical protein